MVWTEGVYDGLVTFECNYGCFAHRPTDTVRLTVTSVPVLPPEGGVDVPEPASLAVLGAR